MSRRFTPAILQFRPKVSSPLTAEVIFSADEILLGQAISWHPKPSKLTLTLTLAIDASLSVYLAFSAFSHLVALATILDIHPFFIHHLGSQSTSYFCPNPAIILATLAHQTSHWAAHPCLLVILLAIFVSLKLFFGLIALTSSPFPRPPHLYLLRTLTAYLLLASVAELFSRAALLPIGPFATLALSAAGILLLLLGTLGSVLLLSCPALWLIGRAIDEEDRLAVQSSKHTPSPLSLVIPPTWLPAVPASAIPAQKRASMAFDL